MRKWRIVFICAVLVVAFALRYLLPERIGLTLGSGGIVRGVAINVIAFWTVLAVGFIVILVKLFAGRDLK